MLRDFRADDQRSVGELVLDGLAERWGNDYDPTANPDLDDIWATYVARGSEVVVADHDDVIVGAGTLRPDDAHSAGFPPRRTPARAP